MKAIETLYHRDSVSGMTLLDDGRWVLWGEGYGDMTVITVTIDKLDCIELPNYGNTNHEATAILTAMETIPGGREMTDAEEVMYTIIRNRLSLPYTP
jgi:hypothetical protein